MTRTTVAPSLGLLRDIAAALDEGLLALDDEDRVLVASDRARDLLGIDPGEAQPSLHSTRVDFRVPRLIQAARGAPGLHTRELEIGERELVLRATALDGEPVSVLLLVRDETRLRHLERVRRDFVSNVSHELRTPVTALRLMAETLESRGLDDPRVTADFVRRISLETMHLAQMLEELLELNAIESGLRPLLRERISVDQLLSAVDRLRPLAEAKDISLTVSVAPHTPEIDGDPSRLRQVVRNLVHNATKFTPSGGHISVLAAAGPEGQVLLQCRDDGVGIAPADLPRIFERFWKADSSRQRDGEGSGLGLAIVRHVVEAHGGSISVSSEPRHGTTFTVLLPAASGI